MASIPELMDGHIIWGWDGTGVPMRTAEVTGRAGKPADGSAKTREAKVCHYLDGRIP